MQSPPRLKLIVIAPVDEDILVRSSHFHLLYFIFILVAWRKRVHVKWCLLIIMLKWTPFISFIQNNLFKRVLIVIIPQSQIHQMLLFLTAAELQDNPIKSFVQALRRRPEKNYDCHYLLTCGVFAPSLRLIYTCICDWGGEWGGEGGIVHVQNV